MSYKDKKTAIFIMPRNSDAWVGAEALWITVAGWAAAAKNLFGQAQVVTMDRLASPSEVLDYPLNGAFKSQNNRIRGKFVGMIPGLLKTVFKDMLQWKNSKNWEIVNQLGCQKGEVAFVWEQHDLFAGPGRQLADKFGVPLIIYVHAPVVWEASKWGVKRGFWGYYLENFVEKSALEKADLVAVVSENVKSKVVKMGIPAHKVLVSPMAVDPQLFQAGDLTAHQLRKELNLEGKTVIGWTGSFRSFHGINFLIEAFGKISSSYPNCRLLLVGDGSERRDAQELVRRLGIQDSVIFTGRKPFREIPQYISVFDIAVVSAKNVAEFHYSPLKLREYLAAGKPVLAPNAGEIPNIFGNEEHLKLFEAGDVDSIVSGVEFYLDNQFKRDKIGASGQAFALSTSTWERELKKSLDRLTHFSALKRS